MEDRTFTLSRKRTAETSLNPAVSVSTTQMGVKLLLRSVIQRAHTQKTVEAGSRGKLQEIAQSYNLVAHSKVL